MERESNWVLARLTFKAGAQMSLFEVYVNPFFMTGLLTSTADLGLLSPSVQIGLLKAWKEWLQGSDEPVAQGLGDGLTLGVDLQLVVDIAHVEGYCCDARAYLGRGGLVVMAFDQQL